MSMPFPYGYSPARAHRNAADGGHQSNSWSGLLEKLLVWEECAHQRAELRDIADDPHLLADLGITRDEALWEASKPFWR